MDIETRPSPTGFPVTVDARGFPLPDPPPGPALRVGDLASEAAAIHAALRALLAVGAAGDDDLVVGLIAAETVAERLLRRIVRAGPAPAARCSVHLVRDARRSVSDACRLVEDELARRSSPRGAPIRS